MVIMNPWLDVLLDNPIGKRISMERTVRQDLINVHGMSVDRLINNEDYLG